MPSRLYRIDIDGRRCLVAETEHGYFGLSPYCPHQGARLEVSGQVCPTTGAIFCQAHGIEYSLESGACLANHGAEQDDPGVLLTFEVRREGDLFVVADSGPQLGDSEGAGEATFIAR